MTEVGGRCANDTVFSRFFHSEKEKHTMATTNLIPIHTAKGLTAGKSIAKVIKYVKNPEKTENGSLVTAFACNPQIADQEFAYMKRLYIDRTGRKCGKDDVIAYHLRQSFQPGEITPEEANRLGRELAQRFTHGNHAFIVATHTDRHHIHNHIIFSAVDLEYDQKFRNFWGSSKALRQLNDVICLENGYSVIENPKEKESKKYNKWLETHETKKKITQRDNLKAVIDAALAQNPKDLPELLALLRKDGFEIKHGKHISVKGQGEQRFKRLDSLGDGYTQNDLTERLSENNNSQNACPPQKRRPDSITRPDDRKVNLLVDIQSRLQKAKGPGYEKWAKRFNLKEMAKTFSYLREHTLLNRAELDRRTGDACLRTNNAVQRINAINVRQAELKKLRSAIIQYSKTREIYAQYKKSNWSPKFRRQHEQEIEAHKEAKKVFDSLPSKRIPKMKDIQAEYDRLQEEKTAIDRQYKADKQEMRQLLIVQENVRRILDTDPRKEDRRIGRSTR